MNDLLTLIKERHSSRAIFDTRRPVNKEDLYKILEAGSWAPTAHNMQNFEILLVDDKEIINKIAAVKAPLSIAFIRENYKQLSFSKEELQRKKTGVLGTTFPPSWLKTNIKKSDLIKEDNNESMTEELNSTPVLGIVLYNPSRRAPASEGDFLGIISLGCVMENMWLMANSLGIDFQIVSTLSNGPFEKVIKKTMSIPKKLVIAYSFRLGYAVKNPDYLRVRRDVEDFTHYNKYGKKYSNP